MSEPRPGDRPDEIAGRSGCLVGLGVAIGLFVILFVGTLVASRFIRSSAPPPPRRYGERRPEVGKRLPKLSLQALTEAGTPVTLDELSGKVVLVNFWGPWCRYCKEELPELAALDKKLRHRPDFRLLAVSYADDERVSMEELRRGTQAYLDRAKLDISAYVDADEVTLRSFASLGRFEGFPTTFVMDREGVVRGVWSGYGPDASAEMQEIVQELLVGKP